MVLIWLQVVEDGYEFFAKRQLVTLFSAPNYCGEFDNAGGMMTVDESLLCSFQVSGGLHEICSDFPRLFFTDLFVFTFSIDSEAIGEEGQISIQFDSQQYESDQLSQIIVHRNYQHDPIYLHVKRECFQYTLFIYI